MKSIALNSATMDLFGVKADVIAFYSGTDEALAQTIKFQLESGTPIDITNYTFEFKMRKQIYDSAYDTTRSGYIIKGMEADPDATEINLTSQIHIIDGPTGRAQFYLPPSLTAVGGTVKEPIIYSGFIELQDNASSGELIQKLYVLLIVGA